MEDAATAEISRAQVWQWIRYDVKREDGRTSTRHCAANCSTKNSQRGARPVAAAAMKTLRGSSPS